MRKTSMAKTASKVQLRTVNLEAGRPSAAQAIVRLNQTLASARASGTKAVKLIHGYGSSGKGGVIRREVQRVLTEKKQEGVIRDFVPGEDFSPFSVAGRKALNLLPELSHDQDYSRSNKGITIVLF